jgi:hypothetical protein
MLQAPGSATRWFVVEQAGRVRVFNNDAAVAASTLFVDIAARVRSGGEMGLLGLAFHPQVPAGPAGLPLVHHGQPAAGVAHRRVSQPLMAAPTLDPASEQHPADRRPA